jgi:parvulin-like peptidyl-prolyl isomerase
MDYYIKFLELYSAGKDSTETAATANNLVDIIQYSAAVRKSASELGATVSQDEINTMVKDNGLPDEQVFRDAVASKLLVDKMLQDYFDKEVPLSVEQVETQALFVESTDVAKDVMEKLTAGDNFTSLAASYSLEPITQANGGNVGWIPKGFTDVLLGNLGGSALKDIPFTLRAGEVSQPTFDGTVSKSLGYWVVQVTEKDPTKGSHVRGLLVGSRHDAEAMREKIIAGDDFATLVKDYSQDVDSAMLGGDIGWTNNNTITNRVVLGLAMPLEINAVSQPAADTSVQTTGGFWVVKAINRDDNKALDDNTRQTLKMGLLDDWVTGKMKDDTVETLLSEDQKSWAVNLVIASRGQQ